MSLVRRVLVFGSSQVNYTDSGDSGTTPILMLANLKKLAPETEWVVQSGVVYPNASLVERASQLVERTKPDVILFVPGSNTFAEESVAFSIRKRWPRLYGPAMKLIGSGKAAAGGRAVGSDSARGLLFRLPRAMGRKTFGMAPLIEPKVAHEATRDLFRYLESLGLPVACRLAMGHHQQPEQTETIAARTREFNAMVADECKRLGYHYVSINEAFEARGWDYILGPDNLHETLETRERSSRIWAELVLDALQAAPPQEPARPPS